MRAATNPRERHRHRKRSPDGAVPPAKGGDDVVLGTTTPARRSEYGLEPWLTKRELARALRCSTRTIERLRLPALRVGGQNRYRLSEVEAHLRGGGRQVQMVLFGKEQQEEPGS